MARKTATEAPLFGKNLAAIRKSRGFTQEELAVKIGATCSLINYYERRTKNPTGDVLLKLADALGVSVDFLLKKSGLLPELACQFDTIGKLPKAKQKVISAILEEALNSK